MLNLFCLICFLVYTSSIFFIKNMYLLLAILLLNIIITFFSKIPFKTIIYSIYKYLFIIILTFFFNIIFGYYKDAFIICFKLILVCNIGLVFSYKIGFSNIIISLEKLFTPLKIFKINPKNITLIINIAITSIPIFIKNLNQTLTTMEAKGLKKYSIKSLKYTSKLLLFFIFKKTNELEFTLKVKNYQE